MADYFGKHGGRVLRAFKGGGMSFVKDGILTPEMVKDWPLRNRIALHVDHKVEWYGPLDAEEVAARTLKAEEVPVEPAPVAKAPASRRSRR